MKKKTDIPTNQASGEVRRAVIYARVSSKEQEKEGYLDPGAVEAA